MVQSKLWPKRKTLPLWRALLDAGNDVWVPTAALLEAHPITSGPMSLLLNRWLDRGWLEREQLTLGRPAEWRLTLHGRSQVRLMIEDDERERAVMASVWRRS